MFKFLKKKEEKQFKSREEVLADVQRAIENGLNIITIDTPLQDKELIMPALERDGHEVSSQVIMGKQQTFVRLTVALSRQQQELELEEPELKEPELDENFKLNVQIIKEIENAKAKDLTSCKIYVPEPKRIQTQLKLESMGYVVGIIFDRFVPEFETINSVDYFHMSVDWSMNKWIDED